MKRIYTPLAIALVSAVITACSTGNSKTTEQSAIDQSAIAVKLSDVKEESYVMPVVGSGLIATGTESRLSFKTGGVISRILVEEGQSVSKGQLLATLDMTEINAQVSQAKNGLDKARRDLERVERLYKDSAATLEQFQNVKTAFAVAEESWRVASFNQQYSEIHANASGKVIRKFVNEGELIGGGMPVLMINSASENDWIVRLGLPDVDWVRISRGDKAVITTDAYGDVELEGKVSLINEGADPFSGLYQVEVQIFPKGVKLATGLVAKVSIEPSSRKTMKSVPIEAIVEGMGKNAYVFAVAEDGKAVKKLPVTVAYIDKGRAIISKGLEGTPKVITAGSAFLTEYSQVLVSE